MTLNLRKLVSVSAQLSLQGCNIIRQSLSDKSLKRYLKGIDDPVTDADFKIQSMIVKGLKMHFPQLKIIGEEIEEFKGHIEFDYASLNSDILPQYSLINQQLDANDACLWIDPIDCTKGFLNGSIEDVTILLGLSYGKQAHMGVIATPYKKIDNFKFYEPIITIGSVLQRETLELVGKSWIKKTKSPTHQPLVIITSNSRSSESQQNFIHKIQGISLKAGGSGRKIMMVVNGQADAMIYIDAATHKWDSCAGDAIIRSMGGYLKTTKGEDIVYNSDRQTTANKEGMVAALDKQIYQKCMRAIQLY